MHRKLSIEYVKAILVIIMVLTHSFTFVGTLTPGELDSQLYYFLSVMGKLIIFSGFIFCFGYASYHAYLAKSFETVKPNLIRTAKNQLIGYYLSALLAVVLLPIPGRTGQKVALTDVWDVLRLQYVAPFSEFLLTYFLITVCNLLFFRYVSAAAQSSKTLIILGSLSVASTLLIPYDLFIDNPLGLLIGSRNYASFPLVQYLCFYVAGIYFARFNVTWRWPIAVVSVLGTSAFLLYYNYTGELPARFPPATVWICGSWGILYGLYLLVSRLVDRGFRSALLLKVGSNTLLFLILSNSFLFAINGRFKTTPFGALLVGVLILTACGYIIRITRKQTPQGAIVAERAVQSRTPVTS